MEDTPPQRTAVWIQIVKYYSGRNRAGTDLEKGIQRWWKKEALRKLEGF